MLVNRRQNLQGELPMLSRVKGLPFRFFCLLELQEIEAVGQLLQQGLDLSILQLWENQKFRYVKYLKPFRVFLLLLSFVSI